MNNPADLHIYEFGIDVTQPSGETVEFTTTFISQYRHEANADDEAKDAAHRWGSNLHRTLADELANPGWKVHIRQGGNAICWYNPSETVLKFREDYRFVGIVNI